MMNVSYDEQKWKLVPVTLTNEMARIGGHVNSEYLNDSAPLGESRYKLPIASIWKEMIAAAPTPDRATKAEAASRNAALSFEQIEDAFPEDGLHTRKEDGACVVSAQWLHDFAANIWCIKSQPAAAVVAPVEAVTDWPEEPTPEMQDAGARAVRFDTPILNKMWTANAVYRAMRAAILAKRAGGAA
jgi:hypothetical protein